MSLAAKEAELLAALAPLRTAQDRLAWLVEQARQRPLLPAELRTEDRRVEGCLSKLWFVPEHREGRCWFRTESDSLIVKAVAGVLADFFNGQTAAEILAHPAGLVARLGIQQHLTTNRRAGLARVEEKIRDFAAGKRDS
jgi:cysteine desulfuration protein SufE